MKIGILGTGIVGETLGTRLIELGHEVKLGSRTASNEKARSWVNTQGSKASQGTFEDAANYGEIIFLCTKGDATLEVLKMAKLQHFTNKIVIDVTNPLDFSKGMPPSLFISNTNSLGEEIQKLLKDSHVVKALNTISADVMIRPEKTGDITLLLCGNNQEAKNKVKELLQTFGWKDFLDLGDISGARATEMYLPLWLRTWMKLGHANFGFKLVKKSA